MLIDPPLFFFFRACKQSIPLSPEFPGQSVCLSVCQGWSLFLFLGRVVVRLRFGPWGFCSFFLFLFRSIGCLLSLSSCNSFSFFLSFLFYFRFRWFTALRYMPEGRHQAKPSRVATALIRIVPLKPTAPRTLA